MMKQIKKFTYPGTNREMIEGKRHYVIGKEKLPSVTTILSATQSEEKKASLERWKQRVGEEQAEKIKNTSANRGTIMHKLLEKHVLGQGYEDLTDLGQQAKPMAQMIVERGLSRMEAFYGTEVTLHYPELYAGQTDLVGIFDGKDSILILNKRISRNKESGSGITLYNLARILWHTIMFTVRILKKQL